MSNTTMNGRPQRKTLASQLDRLENVIDALAEGLPDTVAQAVRQAVSIGVQEAVHALVQEALHNPEILSQLTGAQQPAPVANRDREPSRLKKSCTAFSKKVGETRRWLGWKLSNARGWIGHKISDLRISALMVKVWECRNLVARSAVVGLLMGVGGYFTGPAISAVTLGLFGATLFLTYVLLLPVALLDREMNTQNL